jgi:hypothetical protein
LPKFPKVFNFTEVSYECFFHQSCLKCFLLNVLAKVTQKQKHRSCPNLSPRQSCLKHLFHLICPKMFCQSCTNAFLFYQSCPRMFFHQSCLKHFYFKLAQKCCSQSITKTFNVTKVGQKHLISPKLPKSFFAQKCFCQSCTKC